MLKYLLGRLLAAIITLLGVSILAFGLIRLVPGDPVLVMLGERGANPEVYERMRASMGLDQPIYVQYLRFAGRALQGDLGLSTVTSAPVIEEFFDRFPATLELGFAGLFWAMCLGIPLGIIAAVKRNSVFDYVVMGGALLGYSMPIFWWGLILILWFSVGWSLTPVSGQISLIYDVPVITGFMLIDTLFWDINAFWSAVRHLILPAVALGTIPLAVITRMTRSSMLEVLGEDYIRTAKAKGLTNFQVIAVHGLRNALIPIVTVIGLQMGTIVTGAILTETIFSWPGIGKWLFHSISALDYPVVQGGILLIAAMILFINMTIDMIYILVNPKIREI